MRKLVGLIILTAVVLVLFQETRTPHSPAAKDAITSLSTAELSTTDFQKALNAVKNSYEGSEQTFLIENFLSIELARGGKRSQQALQVLQMALRSQDDLTRKEALQQTRSLLIDVAHGQASVAREMRPGLNELFRIFKAVGRPEIRLIAKANPQSPTLTYLQSLR